MRTTQKARKVKFLTAAFFAVVLLAATLFSFSASAESGAVDGWNFNDKEKYSANPIYMENHITEIPKTFEAYVNHEAGGTSPIISSFPGKKNRDSIHFGVDYRGYPSLQVRQIVWIPEEAKYAQLQTVATFTDEASKILGKGWTHVAITYEPGADASGTFTLYINGVNTETIVSAPSADEVTRLKNSSLGAVPALDIEYMQSGTREFSFGAEGSTSGGAYFRGKINSAAMYSSVLSADDIASSFENGVNGKRSDIIAYYDYDMSGNDGTDFIKDQSGNGHDFSVSFYERTSEPKDYAYSFAFVGDTQFTVKFEALDPTQNYASSIYDWLVENKESKKIKYVLGLGDITESHTTPDLWPGEWELAVDLHKKLEDAEMPYAIIEGNHDGYAKEPGTINQYFGNNTYFTNTITGYYREGLIDSYYVNFDVGLHKYMIVALEHGADDDVLAWANEVVSANPDRRVIVITHALLSYDGEWTQDGKIGSNKSLNDGIDVWNKFISLHKNIIIAAAGHIDVDHIKRKSEVGVNGNTVETFLINPQTLDEANVYETGMIAMFYFSDDGSDVQVEYISAYKTLEAQKNDTDAKDVLFGKKSQFSFKTAKTVPLSSNTDYGYMDPEVWEGNAFALFSSNEFVASFTSYSALCQYLNGATADNYQILLLKDYDNSVDNVKFPILNANVIIDLGGNAFTVSNKLIDLFGTSENLAVTVKNGSIVAKNTVIGTSANAIGNVSAVFEDVTFDFSSLKNNITLFDLDDTNVVFDIRVLGGKIVSAVSTLDSVEFYAKDANDTLIYGEYNDSYTRLITHTTAFDYNHYAGAFPTADGNRYFVEISDNGNESVYVLRSLTVVGEDASGTIDLATYGAKVLSAIDYPFVVTDSTGALIGISKEMYGSKSVDSAYGLAKIKIGSLYNSKTNPNPTVYILMRADYTMSNAETYDLTYIQGTVVLDMNGYSISSTNTRSTHMFEPKLRSATYVTTLRVKNGAINHGGKDANKYVVCFSNNNNADNFAKTFKFEFDSVTFSLIEGAPMKKLFHVGNANKYADGVKGIGTVNFTLTDCIFDLRDETVNEFTVLDTNFGQSNAYLDSTVKINGGKILANSLTKLKFTNFSCDAKDSVSFGAGSDGEYIRLVLPKGADASKFLMDRIKVETENGKEAGFILASKEEFATYKLYFSTKYGYAPAQYSDSKYVFLVFDAQGNFINASEVFNAKEGTPSAIYYAREYLKGNRWDKTNKTYGSNPLSATILVMGEYTLIKGENVKNMHHIQGTLTVDLNDNTITQYAYQSMFNSEMNQWTESGDESIFPTEIIVKNGNIVNGSFPVVAFTAKKAGKEFSYKFENINFKVVGDMSARMSSFVQYGSETVATNSSVAFNGCNFDITASTAKSAITLFGIGNQYYNISVAVNGGAIIAGNKAFNFSNETTGSGKLTFGTYNDEYTTLSVSAASSLPTATFNNGALVFVKVSADESEKIYALAPVKIRDYVPKMSVTLDSDLVVNVYVPVAGTESFILNGVEWNDLNELSDAKVQINSVDYYKIGVCLGACEAASTIELVVFVDFGSGVSRGTFTFGIIKYAENIIAGNNSAEKTLVKDILSYIRAAYDYFGVSDAEKIAKIDALLGENYDAENAPVMNGSADVPTVGLKGATFVLNATPAIRFYLADGADASKYTFFADGKKLDGEVGSDSNGTYIEISVFAYLMGKTIEYRIDGVSSGSYHINSYYEFAKTQNNKKLVTLVERFAKYCESAEDYRRSVIGTEN